MTDPRTEPRIEVSLTARWEGSATNHNVRVSDICSSGGYIDTVAEVVVGEPVSLKILLPNGDWFEPEAVVAHHTRFGFGVRFLNLTEKQQEQLGTLLTTAPRAESPDAPANIESPSPPPPAEPAKDDA